LTAKHSSGRVVVPLSLPLISPGPTTVPFKAVARIKFNRAANGLLFCADTIFDYDGQALGGRYAEES